MQRHVLAAPTLFALVALSSRAVRRSEDADFFAPQRGRVSHREPPMLSEYEAAVLTRFKASDADRRLHRVVPGNNRIAAALVVLGLLLPGLVTMSPSFADSANKNSCAMRDTRFLLQLDQYREQGNMPGEKLYAAYLTMLRARTACSAGRPEEALQLYDSAFGPVQAPE
jgi:hypothetical protein